MPSKDAEFIPVFLERSCFLGIMMASMEVFSRETMGFLVGRHAKRFISGQLMDCVVLGQAFPLQTAERTTMWVTIGNKKAFDRARKTAGVYGFSILGEFHSHPNDIAILSKGDKNYIREEIVKVGRKELKLVGNRWLEVVVGITKRKYKRPQRVGWFPTRSRKRRSGIITGILRTDTRSGFSIKIRAYWVSISKVRETPIYYSAY